MANTVIGMFPSEAEAARVTEDLTQSGFSQREINRHDSAGANLRSWLESQGVPQNEADDYIAGVERGGKLVAIEVGDDRADEARSIMERHLYDGVSYGTEAGTDPARRAGRQSGERAGDAAKTGMKGDTRPTQERREERGERTIPVTEEELEVGTRQVERGGVRVRSYVTEEPVEKQVRVRDESVNVDRRPADRTLSPEEADAAFQERTVEMTESDEELHVEKRARVIEEVVLSKDVDERTETVRDTVRRTEVEVEEADADGRATFDRDREHFRTHHRDEVRGSRYGYDEYEPAYRYGVDLANHADYRDRSWKDVEPKAREHWERTNPDTWREFEPAVRYGYERGSGRSG